jgi:hypothetical protein
VARKNAHQHTIPVASRIDEWLYLTPELADNEYGTFLGLKTRQEAPGGNP